VAAYLDRVGASLAGLLPEERRAELRAELRDHLEALIAAHEELGASPEEAVTAALRQFGGADDLARAWRSAGPPALRSRIAAAAGGLACAGSAALAATWLVSVPAQIGISPLAVLLGGPLLPLVLGFLAGRARGRHPLGSWWGMAGIGLLSLLATAALPSIADFPLLLFAVIQLCTWMVTACGAAGLGMIARPRRMAPAGG
jgi:HAAS